MPHFGEFKLQDIPILHLMHFTLKPGVTDITLDTIPLGTLDYNCHFTALAIAVDPAPGAGKTVSLTLSDGTDSITATVTGAETTDKATGLINLDVETETLTLKYTQTAGGATTKATVAIRRWFS